MNRQIDLRARKNVVASVCKAGTGVRIGAFLIDLIVISSVMAIVYVLYMIGGDRRPDGLSFALMPLASIVLVGLRDIFRGESLGKRVLGLAVRDDKDMSQIPSTGRLILRNVLTCVWPVEGIALLSSKNQKKLGDRIAHTQVYSFRGNRRKRAMVISIALFIALFMSASFIGVNMTLVKSEPFAVAMAHIRADAELAQAIGDIAKPGTIRNGSINTTGGYGEAEFEIHLQGSKDTAIAYVILDKEPDGEWTVQAYLASK